MKKVWILLVFFGLCIFLSACKPNEQAQAYINKGNIYMEEKKYDKATIAFGNAVNADNKPETIELLTKARKKQLEGLELEYNKFFSEIEFQKATDLNKRIQKDFSDLLSDDQKDKYKKDAARLKKYLTTQKLYDDYIVWAKPQILKLKSNSDTWDILSKEITLETRAYSSIKAQLSKLIVSNYEVRKAFEIKKENVDTSLAEINDTFLNVVRKYDSSYTVVMSKVDKALDMDEISQSAQDIVSVTSDLDRAISKLRAYAKDNGIKDNYNSVLVDGDKGTLHK